MTNYENLDGSDLYGIAVELLKKGENPEELHATFSEAIHQNAEEGEEVPFETARERLMYNWEALRGAGNEVIADEIGTSASRVSQLKSEMELEEKQEEVTA